MDAEQEIHNRIGEHGRITFAKFMEIALFWPTGGYYSRQHNIGPTGDFYTGPKAHPAFGALLSIQLLQMWQLLDRPSPFWVIEMGANDGLLARDIISYCAYLPPDFRDCIRYMCLDRSSRQGLDEEASYRELPSIQRVTASFAPLRNVIGCFLSNELMDSFPVPPGNHGGWTSPRGVRSSSRREAGRAGRCSFHTSTGRTAQLRGGQIA